MRAVHLNYHEVTRDPRVLKECESLAASGVDITVVCAQEGDRPRTEKIGEIEVKRIEWLKYDGINREYIESLSAFRRTYPFLHSRFQEVLTYNAYVSILDEMEAETGIDFRVRQNPREYKKYRGLKRVVEKIKGRYNRHRSRRELTRYLEFQNEPDCAAKASELREYGIDAGSILSGKLPTRVSSIGSKLYQAAGFLFDFNLAELNLQGPVDIVHAHDIYTLPAGVSLAKRLGAKLIYDAHEYEIERASKMPPEGNAMVDALELDCLEHVDGLITVSNGIQDLYRSRFPKREPVVILNSPDIEYSELSEEKTASSRSKLRSGLGLAHDTPLLGYTGWVLKEQRGLGKVVEALALLPDFHLVVLGPRRVSDDARLMHGAEAVGVSDRVHLMDPVHHSEVVSTISGCDVGIIPFQDSTLSYRFAMPNKLFESVFAGLPVCVSDLPDMKEFVETLGRGRSMDQTDASDIAKTISELYDRRDDFRMTEAERRSLFEAYGWPAQVKKLCSLYSELTEDPADLSVEKSA